MFSRGPNRKTIRRRLGLSYHKYRAELRATLASVRAIALTIDMWTKKRTTFICLTGHAFNNKYESIPLILGFRRLSGPLSSSQQYQKLYSLRITTTGNC